jgi:hypothetical protein
MRFLCLFHEFLPSVSATMDIGRSIPRYSLPLGWLDLLILFRRRFLVAVRIFFRDFSYFLCLLRFVFSSCSLIAVVFTDGSSAAQP